MNEKEAFNRLCACLKNVRATKKELLEDHCNFIGKDGSFLPGKLETLMEHVSIYDKYIHFLNNSIYFYKNQMEEFNNVRNKENL